MEEGNKDKDRHLPIANIGKIMKRVLPDNSKMTKDAKDLVQECVSEFICFVTGIAADRCTKEKRKTINGDDILKALQQLGFAEHAEIVRVYFERKVAQEAAAAAAAAAGGKAATR
ncbi:CCAAT-box binding factor HAP3 [Selaginella moellendorffii]|uniref:CCAAT-box binding factor HAP3 n=1 Tax=Selaginella moellendorffii TaxID=88036 RepID=D8SDQ7_SELML|nr:nuclear transcription factor Y subunit B-10 [Selaginella moellendorffii]EFJ17554.1 CCAAT-box binding factor HAP3 [Selaginella moellendorffii]|eukprot:XP_024542183.1 nuclear transcription factor Y subunit B-10 [Selaginella moellendorffii]